MIVIVIVQLPEACMQYRNIISMGKAREMTASIIIYIQSIKGLVGNDNYFITHYFHGYNKHVLALKNCMNVCPGPQELY